MSLEFQPDRYYTSDVDLAAFLICMEREFLGIEMEGTRGFFVFRDTHALAIDVQGYLDEAQPAMVEARIFAAQRTRLYRLVRDLVKGIRR